MAQMMLIDLRFTDPPNTQTVEVVASIVQHVTVARKDSDGEPVRPAPSTFRLCVVRISLSPGRAARIRELVRLPKAPPNARPEDVSTWCPLRPTTFAGSVTPLRFAHEVRPRGRSALTP